MSAYVVMIRERVKDADELARYGQLAPLARDGHAVAPLAFYGAIDGLEGLVPDGVVIHRFPSMPEARAWYDSAEYQQAKPHRLKGADYQVFIVEGIDGTQLV